MYILYPVLPHIEQPPVGSACWGEFCGWYVLHSESYNEPLKVTPEANHVADQLQPMLPELWDPPPLLKWLLRLHSSEHVGEPQTTFHFVVRGSTRKGTNAKHISWYLLVKAPTKCLSRATAFKRLSGSGIRRILATWKMIFTNWAWSRIAFT